MSEPGAGAGVSTPFDGSGEFRALLRSTDWSSHPLGMPHSWPSRLLDLVDVCAGSTTPMALWWEPSSPRRLVLCNDACRRLIGIDGVDPDKAMSAAWPGVDALVAAVVASGREAVRATTGATLSAAPVRDADGPVLGVCLTITGWVERAQRTDDAVGPSDAARADGSGRADAAAPADEARAVDAAGLLDHVLRLLGGPGPVVLTRAQADDLVARVRTHADRVAARERVVAQAETRVSNLEAALRSNRRIGQAIGILMAGRRITEQQAFELLRDHSQHTQRKLRDVAEDVTFTGDLPSQPDRQRQQS